MKLFKQSSRPHSRSEEDRAWTILWLGAHKTGTTFLQHALDLSQPSLKESGVHYVGLDEFRAKYGTPIRRGEDGIAASEYVTRRQGLNLIFDENIPAFVQHALKPAGIYPLATQSADRVLEHLELVPDEIVFGIRSYRTFLPSLYCETLKSTPFCTFEQFLARSIERGHAATDTASLLAQMEHIRWSELLVRLAQHYPDARVRTYQYEKLRGNEASLLSAVTELPAARFTLPSAAERPGFSGRAIHELTELSRQQKVERSTVWDVTQQFPKSSEFSGFAPFDEESSSRLEQRYRDDLDLLRADARVEFIEFG